MGAIQARVENALIKIRFGRHPRWKDMKDAVKTIPGRAWNKEQMCWEVPATSGCANEIQSTLAEFGVDGCEAFHSLANYGRRRLEILRNPKKYAGPIDDWPGAPLWENQRIGARLVAGCDGVYLAHQMATGKTLTCLVAECVMAKKGRIKLTLVVAPLKVTESGWPKQWRAHGLSGINFLCLAKGKIIERAKQLERVLLQDRPLIVVVNYEAILHNPLSALLQSIRWDLVIIDEAHRIKSHKGKTSMWFDELRPKVARRVCMSGTPIQSSPADLFAQCRFVDPFVFGLNYFQFEQKYQINLGDRVEWDTEALNERFKMIAHRVRKDEILDLPPISHVPIEVELGESTRAVYSAIESNFVAHMDDGTITIANGLVELVRLQQITGGHIKYDEQPLQCIDTSKMEALAEFLDGLEPTEPVCVFANFHCDLDAIKEAAKKAGRGCVEVSGRANGLAEWQEKDGPPIIAVQIDAGGEGIDLTRACYQVFYSVGFSWGKFEQAMARTHRPGQLRPVTYVHLIVPNTVDEVIYKVLQKKSSVAADIIEQSIHRDVIDIIREKHHAAI